MDRKVLRVFTLIQILLDTTYPLSLDDMELRLEERGIALPSRRTIFRDLQDIQRLGYTITSSRRGSLYQIQNKADFAGSFFTHDMVQALHMGKGLFRYFEGTIFKETLDRAISMITASTNPYGDTPQEIDRGFSVQLGPCRDYRDKRDVVDEVISALYGGYRLRITYVKMGEVPKTFSLSPYRMIIYHDSLYLLGLKEGDSFLKIFHITRIDEAEQEERVAHFDPALLEEYEDKAVHSFGIMTYGSKERVRLRFAAESASFIYERVWHESQKIEETKSGDIILTMDVFCNDELVTWVLGLSGALRDIAPPCLKEMVQRRCYDLCNL
ncbi:helix-turn-helix transcriptional regulator [Chitinivibrio alkaliphilus]|uniref:Transcriptional regulator n=1 Tax=Chitinivibrio alkaliphilus ACht1 TaxID=1313304 RepID=U7DCK7_9BACT|nr:transcriptional regulator [Chitinivibrio alkaliphilus]ERP39278.1 transcriptional regulator [Chitinivibrio alkaliphilus ACht1]